VSGDIRDRGPIVGLYLDEGASVGGYLLEGAVTP
jgi:hypothetical protein